jgi:hypothetical protein
MGRLDALLRQLDRDTTDFLNRPAANQERRPLRGRGTTYPGPAGYRHTRLAKTDTFCDTGLGQFILPYDAVRQSEYPDRLLLGFLQESDEAVADLGKWHREALER